VGHGDEADPGRAEAQPANTAATASRAGRRRSSGGVSVIAGGLLQDLEERLRRDLAPVELRVRAGEELRGLTAGAGEGGEDPLVIVLPPPPPERRVP
jgi:hypothetical protein